jgi:hypothetical protein
MRLYCVTWECDHFVEAESHNKTWFSSLQKAKAFCVGLKRREDTLGTAYIQRVEIPARKTAFLKLLNNLNDTLTYLTNTRHYDVVTVDQVEMSL